MRIPKSYASVGSAAASGKETRLIRTPSYGFNGCLMLREFCNRLITVPVPDHEFIIVASTRQLLAVVGPFEPTNLLLMAYVLVRHAVLNAEVAAEDEFVFRASAYDRSIPCNGTYPLLMLVQASYLLTVIDVPDLRLAVVGADGQMIALVAPADARDFIVTNYFAELLHLRGAGAPNIDCFVEADCENVCGAPVDQI